MDKRRPSLYDSISEAQRNIEDKEIEHTTKQKISIKFQYYFRPGILVLILIGIIMIKYFMLNISDRNITNDFTMSGKQLLIEADSSIKTYFKLHGELPDIIPDTVLNSYVHYEKLNDLQYALQLDYEPYNRLFIRNILISEYQTDLSKAFNSLIP